MKSTSFFFSAVIVAVFLLTSCSKEPLPEVANDTIYAIRSVLGYGKTHARFVYNSNGKIAEYQSLYFCSRYSYDDSGRCVKEETAADPDQYSSQSHERIELMTSQNSAFTGYSMYQYDQDGKLISIRNYFKKNIEFEYTSMKSFEYDGDKIVKLNLHNSENTINQFYTFEYDNNKNVVKEEQYSLLLSKSSVPELIGETSYKYDNQNNPFKIYSGSGRPGLYTNTNNIIETNSNLFIEVPGMEKNSTSKTEYEYNIDGFPVKVITENSIYEYTYK